MTVLLDGRVSGNILSFTQLGHPEVCYWLGKEFWGRGVATKALVGFLALLTARPLYARAARDNVASLRVLEKCGFMLTGYETAFANARGKEIEEALFRLDCRLESLKARPRLVGHFFSRCRITTTDRRLR